MHNRIEPRIEQADPLLWAEKNLSAIAKFTAGQMNGGAADHIYLSATFALLRARQQIRQGIREVELLRLEVAR